MANSESVYRAFLTAALQQAAPVTGSTEDASAAVAAGAKFDTPDLTPFHFPHVLPAGAAEAGLTPDSTLSAKVRDAISRIPERLRGKVALAVADLTGSKAAPRYAGFNDQANFDSASVGKICGLLAAYQFETDVNRFLDEHATLQSAPELASALERHFSSLNLARPYPRSDAILHFHPGARPRVSLVDGFKARLEHISDGNENGSAPVALLNYPYLASVLLAYGLFDTTRQRGFWIRSTWLRFPPATPGPFDLAPWTDSPLKPSTSHSVSALAATRYFTLAAQGKLVNRATSQRILENLAPVASAGGCLLDNIDTTPLTGTIAAKCGYYDGRSLISLHYKSPPNLPAREVVVSVFAIKDAEAQITPLFAAALKLLGLRTP